MKRIEIRTLDQLHSIDLSNFEVIEDTEIDIQLRLIDTELQYPISITHEIPDLLSSIRIKIALFGKSKVTIPVQIRVKKGARGTSTGFKALVYQMSPHAHANITPGLFIEERNINAASHGVVIKNIKDKDLLYLRSRGIERERAREMIIDLK